MKSKRKKGAVLFLLVANVVLFCGCGCVRRSASTGGINSSPVMFRHWDSAFVNGLDGSKRVVVYKLNPLADSVASGKGRSIVGFSVVGRAQSLTMEQLAVLRFILGNEKSYVYDAPVVKTLFAPYFAIEVNGEDGDMYLLLAFNTSELAFAKEGKIVKKVAWGCKDLLVQFGLELFPGDEYLSSITMY